jgi:hypothetical protein
MGTNGGVFMHSSSGHRSRKAEVGAVLI